MKDDYQVSMAASFTGKAQPSWDDTKYWEDLKNSAEYYIKRAKTIIEHQGENSPVASCARVILSRANLLKSLALSKEQIGDWNPTPIETALIDTYQAECDQFTRNYEDIWKAQAPTFS